jgi:hypothetical protein
MPTWNYCVDAEAGVHEMTAAAADAAARDGLATTPPGVVEFGPDRALILEFAFDSTGREVGACVSARVLPTAFNPDAQAALESFDLTALARSVAGALTRRGVAAAVADHAAAAVTVHYELQRQEGGRFRTKERLLVDAFSAMTASVDG